MTSPSLPFTAVSRRALLDEFFAVNARLEGTPTTVEPDATDLARYAELRRSYREQLPVVPVSRCPFTKAVYQHSLDTFGIDGPWWDYRSTNRPLELLTGTVLAFTGALSLATDIARAPFLVRPGPGAPFVVPRILTRSGVRAVVYALPIGAHTGYVMTYFADPAPDDLEGFNDWGTDFYQFEYDTDRLGWYQGSETAADHDFDLEPYLESGQLLWIAPGDASMTLREGAAQCPYVNAEGCRVPQLVQHGERWLGAFPIDEDAVDVWDISAEADATVDDAPSVAVSTAPTLLARDEPALAPRPVPPPVPPFVEPSASAARTCSSCGTALTPTSKFCRGCGAPVATPIAMPPPSAPPPAVRAENVCGHCRQPRRTGSKFCKHCGKP